MPLGSAIQLFAESLVLDLQANLKKKLLQKAAKYNSEFSGDSRLGASIRIEYLQFGDTIYGFNLYMSDYYYWVNKGRESGKGVSREGQEKMAAWVRSRGMTPTLGDRTKKRIAKIKDKKVKKQTKQISYDKKVKQVVFIISKTIKERGYEANHFMDEVLADGRLKRFSQYLKEQYKQDLELEIVNIRNVA